MVLEERRQGGAVDQLHGEVGQSGLLARSEVVHRRNAPVAEFRGDPALTLEALDPPLCLPPRRGHRQELHGYAASQDLVPGVPYLAHSPRAELALQLIAPA